MTYRRDEAIPTNYIVWHSRISLRRKVRDNGRVLWRARNNSLHIFHVILFTQLFRYSAIFSRYKAPVLVFHKYAHPSDEKEKKSMNVRLLKLAVDAYALHRYLPLYLPLFHITSAMHLSACLIHFTRRSIHRTHKNDLHLRAVRAEVHDQKGHKL